MAPRRQESPGQAGQTALAAASLFTRTTESHLDAARVCSQQGVRFQPFVAEASSVWSRETAPVLLLPSQAVAARQGEEPFAFHARMLQELCVITRLHRARVVFRRRCELQASGSVMRQPPLLLSFIRLGRSSALLLPRAVNFGGLHEGFWSGPDYTTRPPVLSRAASAGLARPEWQPAAGIRAPTPEHVFQQSSVGCGGRRGHPPGAVEGHTTAPRVEPTVAAWTCSSMGRRPTGSRCAATPRPFRR